MECGFAEINNAPEREIETAHEMTGTYIWISAGSVYLYVLSLPSTDQL